MLFTLPLYKLYHFAQNNSIASFFFLGTKANWYRANSFTQYRVKQSKRKRRELVPAPVSMANEFYTNIALQVRVSPNSSNVVIFLASNSLGTEFNRIDVSSIKSLSRAFFFYKAAKMRVIKGQMSCNWISFQLSDNRVKWTVIWELGDFCSVRQTLVFQNSPLLLQTRLHLEKKFYKKSMGNFFFVLQPTLYNNLPEN